MKRLYESLLDDEDVLMNKTGDNLIENLIESFLKNTYIFKNASYKIYKKNNNFFVDIKGRCCSINPAATSFKNDLFEWGDINLSYLNVSHCQNLISLEGIPIKFNGNFNCSCCRNLKSLKGAPKKVKKFNCSGCTNLTSLKDAPEKCYNFKCMGCFLLTSLEGAPKEVKGDFDCSWCRDLKSLKGAPKEVKGDFDCSACENLRSLEGVPKEIEGSIYCYKCNKQFTEEEVKSYTNVKKFINC